MTTKQEQIDRLETECLTRQHIGVVQRLLNRVAFAIMQRGEVHDATKLEEPEMSGFSQYLPELKNVTYDSKEYRALLSKLQETLKCHYAKNRHHPEFFENGIRDMNLIDLVEMIVDWASATKKHNDGNLRQSIEANIKRFNISDQLPQVLRNTITLLESFEEKTL